MPFSALIDDKHISYVYHTPEMCVTRQLLKTKAKSFILQVQLYHEMR